MSKYVAIDFETANYSRTSACSVGLVTVSGNKIVAEEMFLIKPESQQFTFTHIHGLTWDDVKNAKSFVELWPEINEIICGADFLVAHNASFDKGVLVNSCRDFNLPVPCIPFVCTVQLARKQWKIKPTTLNNVCNVLDIPLNHHEALSDARASANIVMQARKEGWSYLAS